MHKSIILLIKNQLASEFEELETNKKVEYINEIREALHDLSPFKHEPVDFIRWVSVDSVQSNDYNPNSVAPPEMALLEHSIGHDRLYTACRYMGKRII